MPTHTSPTNAIEKTCRVLSALTDPRSTTLARIAEATGIHKVSVLRVLETLMRENLIERVPGTREYRYGLAMYAISSALQSRVDLKSVAAPGMQRLAERSGDTVLLVVRSGLECVCVARETGNHPIHASTLHIGSRRPLGVGSGPMAVLAWMDEDEQQLALDQLASRPKLHARFTAAYTRRLMEETKDRGCAIIYDAVLSQVGGIGMAILDLHGRPVGALSISSLSSRIREREELLSAMLAREVSAISRALASYPALACDHP
jgi:DNA-binding IclR family transcriptional regulator